VRLLPRRKPAATLTLAPDQPLRPTETVTATVVLEEALDQVTAAWGELGYVNSFRYRWAGRRDAAANFDDGSFLTAGQVGTDYGSERDTEEWVEALREPLVVAGGVLAAGSHSVGLRLPSWAPGSSESTVRWEVRLHVERSGKDVETSAALQVLVGAPDPLPELPLIQGTSALSNSLEWDIRTERPCYRPGEEVRGTIVLTPREQVRKGNLALTFVRMRLSHPLTRTPGSDTESFTRPYVEIADDLALTPGVATELPFSAVLPDDAEPTTEAVHSSLEWYVQPRVMFEGLTGGVESARRGIVVFTA
jgi:hypothetical protein